MKIGSCRPASRVLTVVVWLCCLALAQQPRFEVADVHASVPDTTESGGSLPNGIEYRATTLLQLIAYAYGVPADRVNGGPSCIDTDRFDILAKAARPSRPAALQAMLQTLLAERLGLAVTRVAKPVDAYILVIERQGALKEASGATDSECNL